VRRATTYLHRSVRGVPFSRPRIAGGLAAAFALTAFVWNESAALVAAHNALVLALSRAIELGGVATQLTFAYGRPVEVITVARDPSFPAQVAIVAFAAALLLLGAIAYRFPLGRGLAGFISFVLGLSAIAGLIDAPAMRDVSTFTWVWTNTQLLAWLVLPSVSMCLFVVAQPSLARGVLWMIAVEAFAIAWSAVRLVVVLGVARCTGALLLPAMWFAWGLLADVVYLTTFYSWSLYVTLRTPAAR